FECRENPVDARSTDVCRTRDRRTASNGTDSACDSVERGSHGESGSGEAEAAVVRGERPREVTLNSGAADAAPAVYCRCGIDPTANKSERSLASPASRRNGPA